MIRPRAVKAILFDLDGVLVDSRVPIAGSINFALECHGLEPQPPAVLHPLIGDALGDAFSRLLRAQGADPGLADACVTRYREHYRRASVTETRRPSTS